MVIYSITNIINNKIYIGKTKHKNPFKYYEYHINKAFIGYENRKFYNKPLYVDMRKYGKDSFEFQIIDEAKNFIELNEKEIYYIEKYNSYSNNGYNLTKGGDGGDTLSKHPNKKDIFRRSSETFKKRQRGWSYKEFPSITKERISSTLLEYYENNPMTEEHKNKISESLKGRCFSEETIEKFRIVNSGKNNPMYGKSPWNKGQTTETNEKLLQSGRKSSKTKTEKHKNGETVVWNKGKTIGKQSEDFISKRTGCKWKIVYPDGTQEIVLVLKKWCKDNSVPYNKLHRDKKYNGILIYKVKIND